MLRCWVGMSNYLGSGVELRRGKVGRFLKKMDCSTTKAWALERLFMDWIRLDMNLERMGL